MSFLEKYVLKPSGVYVILALMSLYLRFFTIICHLYPATQQQFYPASQKQHIYPAAQQQRQLYHAAQQIYPTT